MIRKIFFIVFFVVIFLTVGSALYFYNSLKAPIIHDNADFIVQRGTPVAMIASQLARAGVIKQPIVFSIYARLVHLDRRIKAGEYEFPSGLSAIDILSKMARGECKLYKITLIEGWTIKDIANYLAQQSFAPDGFGQKFIDAADDKYFVRSLGIDSDTAEGYLFPSTYFIQRPASAEWLVTYLVDEFKKVYSADFEKRAAELGLTKNQVVTLASIIEKETGAEAERPVVSSVFHNRLKKGMLLQSDPTIIYGLANYDGNIHKSDILNPHIYNTYVHPGLPPGPIASPGLASIKAALWPTDTDYLFFVSRNDGTHEFTKTLGEHSRAVSKFQLKH